MAREKDIKLGDGTVVRPGKKKKHLKVYHTLYETNIKSVPGTLRKIAKELETEGKNINEAVVVFDNADGNYDVFGFGPHYADVNGSYTLLHMGADRIMQCLRIAKEMQKL